MMKTLVERVAKVWPAASLMWQIEAALVLLPANKNSHSPRVAASHNHCQVTRVELDEIDNLVRLDIEHHGVVHLDIRIGEADGAAVVEGNVWNALIAQLGVLHTAELVGRLLGRDAVHSEAALGIVDQAEVLVGLLELDDVHETQRVRLVRPSLAVDLYQALHQDGIYLVYVN